MTQFHTPERATSASRHRWLSATALGLLCALAPSMALGQGRQPPAAAAPAMSPDAMAQIQQMQRQMEQLQRQIQQMQGAGQPAPATAPATAQPRAVQPVVAQPVMAQPAMAQKKAAPAKGKAKGKALRKKAVAASSFKPKDIKGRSVKKPVGLAPHVPNMMATKSKGIGTAGDYFIRGVGNTEVIGKAEAAVGMYIDDIYVAQPNFTNFDFFDLEGVDVLRGPQGTSAARNSVAGAINIMYQKPQPFFSGNFEIGYGKYSDKSVRGTVNLPVSDVVLTQIGAYYNDDKGYVKNTTTLLRQNDKRNYGVRFATEMRPMDALTWNLAINHTYSNELNLLNFKCQMFGTAFATPGAPTTCKGRFARTSRRGDSVPSLSALVGDTGAGNVPVTLSNRKEQRKVGAPTRSNIVSSNLAYEISPTTQFNFITGYVGLKQAYNFDLQDGRPGRAIGATNPVPAIQAAAPNGYNTLVGKTGVVTYSQEGRLTGDFLNGAIEYTGGAIYVSDHNRSDAADIVLSSVTAERLIKTKARTYAVYAETDLHVTQNFTFNAGLRYTNEKKRLRLRDLRDGSVNPIVGGVSRPDLRITTENLITAGLPDLRNAKIFTPRAAMSYAFGEDSLAYVSATRGFRAGGWNVTGTDVTTFTPFAPEKTWTYEMGAKTAWLNDSLQADLTIFTTDVTNKQVTSAPTSTALIPTFLTSAPANYRSRGVETEFQVTPFDGMMLFTNVAYQTASYQNIPSALSNRAAACRALITAAQPTIGVCGTSLVTPTGAIADPVRTPKLSGATGVSIDMPTGAGFIFTPALNMSYASRWQNDASNTSFYASANPATVPTAITTTPNATGSSGFIGGSRSGKVFLFNASMAVATTDQGWLASLECENCLNKANSTSSIAGYSFLNEPMRWNFKIKKNF